MAFNFTKTINALDQIAERIIRARNRLDSAKVAFSLGSTDLANIPSDFSTVVTELNAEATAKPGDDAIQDLKAVKDKMVADYQALKADADSAVTALSGFDFS